MKQLILAIALLAPSWTPTPAIAGERASTLEISTSWANPAGEEARAFHLDPGLGFDVRYAFALSRRVALGATLRSHWFPGGTERNGGTWSDSHDASGRVLSAGLFVRIIFNPDGRVRIWTALGRLQNRIELEESFSFREGDFVDEGAVDHRESARLDEIELGGEMDLGRSVVLTATARYGYFAYDFTHLGFAVGAGYRFGR